LAQFATTPRSRSLSDIATLRLCRPGDALIPTTITAQSLAVGRRGVGGPIDLATVTRMNGCPRDHPEGTRPEPARHRYDARLIMPSRIGRPSSGLAFCQLTHARNFSRALPFAIASLAMSMPARRSLALPMM
jgi:hypothetical protein